MNLDNLVTKDYLASRFAEQNAEMEVRFAEQRAYMDTRFAEMDGKFRVIMWILGIIVAVDVLPYLERLMSA